MNNWQLNTPVAFLIFNRPDTTDQVFEAIRAAKPPKLLIVADGPRPAVAGEVDRCKAARSVIERVDWPCEVLTCMSDFNLGCKERITTGLDWVFDQVEEVIILEDDCLPHPDFFRFCEEMLDRYRHDQRVMMITGTNYLLDKLAIEESYCFSRYFTIWGWAAWRRSWSKYDPTMSGWNQLRDQHQLRSLYSQDYMCKYASKMVDADYLDKINTWDTQWFYSCLFNNGLCIVPRVNLISNIGIQGAHSAKVSSNHNFPVFGMNVGDLKHPQLVMPNRLYDHDFFETKFKKNFLTRLNRFFNRWFKK